MYMQHKHTGNVSEERNRNVMREKSNSFLESFAQPLKSNPVLFSIAGALLLVVHGTATVFVAMTALSLSATLHVPLTIAALAFWALNAVLVIPFSKTIIGHILRFIAGVVWSGLVALTGHYILASSLCIGMGCMIVVVGIWVYAGMSLFVFALLYFCCLFYQKRYSSYVLVAIILLSLPLLFELSVLY
ncbi:MAG: hypothetical protein WD049_00945 [Candidatus Paceibacterota bacterium]